MIRRLLTLLLLAPAAVSAQTAELRIEGPGDPVDARAALHRGYPAFPARVLEALGAELETEPGHARVVLFGDTIRFQTTSPFFAVRSDVFQLVGPAYDEGGILYVPHQFFVEWLPERYPDEVQFANGLLRVGSAEPIEVPPPPRVVVIDPGHGGDDPGRIGVNRAREETVALQIAERLAAILEKGGYEVHLTRETDTLIDLADRPRLANEWKAGRPSAVFISIHANAHSSKASGFETFFLSEARTEDERRVAEMENAAVAYEEKRGPDAADARDQILINLRNDFYMHASHDLAQTIQRQLATVHPGPNRGVKQAGFRVLVGAFMPAVLVETAFITHPEESKLLVSGDFQAKLARAIASAVDEFFSTHEHLWATTGDT